MISSVAPPIRSAISHSSRWSRALSIRSGLETGFAVDGLDDVLADAALHLAMHRQQRLLPLGFLLWGQGDEFRLAGLLDFRQRFVVFVLGDVIGVLGRVLHR